MDLKTFNFLNLQFNYNSRISCHREFNFRLKWEKEDFNTAIPIAIYATSVNKIKFKIALLTVIILIFLFSSLINYLPNMNPIPQYKLALISV